MQRLELVPIFIQHVSSGEFLPEDLAALEQALHQAWERGRSEWPEISLSPETFVRYLATHAHAHLPQPNGTGSSSLPESLFERLQAADFYLACACSEQIPTAIRAFEHEYLSKVPAQIAHLQQQPASIDEICQQVRTRLLVRSEDAPPKIATYEGRAPLGSFVRTTAINMACAQLRNAKEIPDDDVLAIYEDHSSIDDNPEIRTIKEKYRPLFRNALADAFAALPADDLYLLKLYYCDDLSHVHLARLFGVSQPTISRRLRNLRVRISEQTQALLKDRLSITTGEFHSLLREVDSQLDISLRRVLCDEETPSESAPHEPPSDPDLLATHHENEDPSEDPPPAVPPI